MKKITVLLAACVLGTSLYSGTVFAAEANPTCVLLKFTDDTRYDRIESDKTLADLVMEKLLVSGKFNFKETKVVPENLEKRLYDERSQEFANVYWAMQYGNFTPLFEGPGFDESKAQSIATARVGQFVTPEITRAIGRANNAEYLIQGTITKLGTGNWYKNNVAQTLTYANSAMSLMGSAGALNFLGPIGALASAVKITEGGIGIRADLRLIKASTGKVVWQKELTGFNSSKEVDVGIIKIGSDKVNSNMYYKAMDNVAQKIADELIADHDAGKMFVE